MRRSVPMEIKKLVRDIVFEELIRNAGEGVDQDKVNEKLWKVGKKKFTSCSLLAEVIQEALEDIGYIDTEEANQAD